MDGCDGWELSTGLTVGELSHRCLLSQTRGEVRTWAAETWQWTRTPSNHVTTTWTASQVSLVPWLPVKPATCSKRGFLLTEDLRSVFVPQWDGVVLLSQVPAATWDNTSASLTTEASTTSATTTACVRKVSEGARTRSRDLVERFHLSSDFSVFCSLNCSKAT